MVVKRKPALLLTLGAVVSLATGGAMGYWLLTQKHALTTELPVGADVVPQTAVMTLTISSDESQWRSLRRFGTPETQAIFDQKLAQLRDRLLTDNGYSYQQDIKPWVGQEITVAVLSSSPEASGDAPLPPPPKPNEQPPVIMVLPIANQLQAQFLLKDAADGTNQVTTRAYEGVQIRETRGRGGQIYSSAVLGEEVVVGTDGKAIEQVIDTYKGKDSVADAAGYRQALSQIAASNPFLRLYVNVPAARAIAETNSIQPVPAWLLTLFQNNQGFVATANLEPEGVHVQGAGWLAADSKTPYEVTNITPLLPNRLPAEALIMTSGSNLQQLWQNYSQQTVIDPRNPLNPDNLRQGVQSLTQLNLEQDLLSWMKGEFSLALLPKPSTGAASPLGGVVLMVQASDRRAADQSLEKLDEVMSSRYRFKVNAGEVAGQPVVNWTSPFGALTVTRGWLDGNVAFLAIGTIANTILPQPRSTLLENELFRETGSTELASNQGRFFIDFDRLVHAEGGIPIPTLAGEFGAFIKAMRAIGVTAAIQDPHSDRYDVHVMLQKTNTNPGPLPPPGAQVPNPTKEHK